MYETIRPSAVADALHYLKDTPLFVKHGTSIDEHFLSTRRLNVDEQIESIVKISSSSNSTSKISSTDFC